MQNHCKATSHVTARVRARIIRPGGGGEGGKRQRDNHDCGACAAAAVENERDVTDVTARFCAL
jgi:hypothetical protein